MFTLDPANQLHTVGIVTGATPEMRRDALTHVARHSRDMAELANFADILGLADDLKTLTR